MTDCLNLPFLLYPWQPSTVLTNLQRGNIQTLASTEPLVRNVHQLAALGELFLCNLDNRLANEVDDHGLTPLLWASSHGQLAAVQTLHMHGANVHYKGPSGECALSLAAANGHVNVLRALLSWNVNVDDTDEDGNTALMFAIYGNHQNCVKELLNHGADITAENSNLDTAYSIAVNRKYYEVQELLEKHTLSLLG